ncbi:mucin-like protein [Sycon ciliatum]|uniref:mucin-like protein n=1 Tax=Sycon ciliatum TaxID=27933 RepID=UPI0031F605D4
MRSALHIFLALSVFLLSTGKCHARVEAEGEGDAESGSGSGDAPTPPTPTSPPLQCDDTDYYDSDNTSCQPCLCSDAGSLFPSDMPMTMQQRLCDLVSGACMCKMYSTGRRCDMCQAGFFVPESSIAYTSRCRRACEFNLDLNCQACRCSSVGTANPMECSESGHCQCLTNYLGALCSDCADNHIYLSNSGHCVAPAGFFIPFGAAHGDKVRQPSLEVQKITISLPSVFPVGESVFARLIISSDGFVSTAESFSSDASVVFAPFYLNDGTARTGNVSYQIHTSADTLGRVNSTLQQSGSVAEAVLAGFNPRYALVVTWSKVQPVRDAAVELTNSYQLVLTTDGCVGFAVFNYMNGSTAVGQGQMPWLIVRNGPQLLWRATPESVQHGGYRVVMVTDACAIDSDAQQCADQAGRLEAITTPTGIACPLSRRHAQIDSSFAVLESFSSDCYTNVFPGNLVCCYDGAGSFLTSGAMASFATASHPLTEAAAFNTSEWAIRTLCCAAGYCDLFYAKRPILENVASQVQAEESGETPAAVLSVQLRSSQGAGDPHFVTFDGAAFTFNGLGDYLLSEAYDASSNTSVVIQIRTILVPNSKATSIASVALALYRGTWESGERVNLLNCSLDSMARTLSIMSGMVDITSMVIAHASTTTAPMIVDQFTAVRYTTGAITVSFSSGVSATISILSASTFSFLTVQGTLSLVYRNQTRGLLGRLNDNPADDFTTRNGTSFPMDIAESTYYLVGQTWRLSDEESLFGSPSPYDPTHQPDFSDMITFSPALMAVCGDNRACLFDSLQTNDTAVGMATQQTQVMLMEQRAVEANFPPVITAPATLSLSLNVAAEYVFNVTDSTPPNVTRETVGNILVAMVTSDSITYTLSVTISDPMTSPPSLRIIAVDSLSAASSFQPLITFCPCRNNQPCLPVRQGQDGGAARSIVALCNCSQAYDGRYCEQDRNGCSGVSHDCATGVECRDQDAPASGYTCGPCPPASTGDGRVCQPIPVTSTMLPTGDLGSGQGGSSKAWIAPVVVASLIVVVFFIIFGYVLLRKQGTVTYVVASDLDGTAEKKSTKVKGEVVPLGVMNPAYEDATITHKNGVAASNGDAVKSEDDEADAGPDTLVNKGALEQEDTFSERPIDVASPDRSNNTPKASNGQQSSMGEVSTLNGNAQPSGDGKEYPVLFL